MQRNLIVDIGESTWPLIANLRSGESLSAWPIGSLMQETDEVTRREAAEFNPRTLREVYADLTIRAAQRVSFSCADKWGVRRRILPSNYHFHAGRS